MHNLGVDLDGAVHWLKTEHARLAQAFLDDLRDLPSFGSKEADDRVREWVGELGLMVRGYVSYCFEAPRYFGKECALVKERGWVELVSPLSPSFDTSLLDPPISSSTKSESVPAANPISSLSPQTTIMISAN